MIEQKFARLKDILRSYESVLVAFSGGVDSAFVLKVARQVFDRERAKAVTAQSESVPRRELIAAQELASALDVEHRVIQTRELENPNYRANSAHRCYFCKTELYDRLLPIADEWRLKTICNGTHVDDLHDVRPGEAAAVERGIKSPLVEAKLTKGEIRCLSYSIGLPVWNKPASPCLSSRFPYGHEITSERLNQVEAGEDFLKELGFRIVRLRHFGTKARLELGQEEFLRAMDVELRDRITKHILSLGFTTVYFEPYKSGALNETLSKGNPIT